MARGKDSVERYFHDWSDYDDLLRDYKEAPPDDQVVFASYGYKDYGGYALVVWRDAEGQWWENNDSHCSCNGLENWKPEPTSLEALRMRKGWTGLQEALDEATNQR